ncbi:MAG TPA: ABC transporter substrate-binding protein [Vicinamibacterales bacterium]|nr:ABC transporter substrate-binding protein [Vicinamibacterales bacterium]
MSERLSRRALLTRLSAAALAAAAGCGRRSSGASNAVHIATAAGGLNLTMSALLRQQKFLESFDLTPDVVAMADGSKILGGIYSGSIDVSPMSGFGQVFPAIERGADLAIINAATLIPALALFSAKPTVRSLKDLEGKVVGVGSIGALIHQLTATLLRKYAVDVSAVRFVNIGSNTDTFKGVMAGTVDAGAGPASFFDDAGAYHVHAIENGNMSVELKEFTYQAGWTSRRVIESKRDVLVRVLAAYARLFRFVHQPSAQDAFLRARKAVFPNAPEREHLGEWNYLQAFKPFATDLMLSPERVRYMQQINLDFHIQREMLPFDRVAEMSLAQEAQKLLG